LGKAWFYDDEVGGMLCLLVFLAFSLSRLSGFQVISLSIDSLGTWVGGL